MRFTHGSAQDIKVEDLNVFDYIIDNNGKPSMDCIDNGNDGEGIGVYAFIGDSEESKTNASCYTTEESAFLYVLEVDIEKEDLMNYRDPDEIPVEEWTEMLEYFVDDLRTKKGCSEKEFNSIIDSFEDIFDNLEISTVNEKLEEMGIKIQLDEWAEPNEFEDFYDWKEQTVEQYELNEPCNKAMEEGLGIIAQSAIDRSDNLWDTMKHIGQSVAILYSDKGTERYNKSYQRAVNEKLERYNLVAAFVNDDNFAVIFDTHRLELIEKINLNKDMSEELKESVSDFLVKKEKKDVSKISQNKLK